MGIEIPLVLTLERASKGEMMEERETTYEAPRVDDLGTLEEITGAGVAAGIAEGLALKT